MKIKKINNEKHITFLTDNIHCKSEVKYNKAIFYDRDGVIIQDKHYIKKYFFLLIKMRFSLYNF